MNNQKYEEKYWNKGIDLVAGIDEAGRGPLAGPVVAACVILNKNDAIEGINDSKKISAKKMLGKTFPLNPSMNISKLKKIIRND